MVGIGGDQFTTADFGLTDESVDPLPPSSGKAPVVSLDDSDDACDVAPSSLAPRDTTFEKEIRGFFIPPFDHVKANSSLNSVKERADYIANIMVPSKLETVELLEEEEFVDFANHSLIDLITAQVTLVVTMFIFLPSFLCLCILSSKVFFSLAC